MNAFCKWALTLLPIASLAASSASAAESRGPSTPEERQYVLELVEMLEATPEAPEAADARKWLVVWLSSVPDLTVHFCTDPLGTPAELERVPPDLQVQAAFSQAAYLIRNPGSDAKSVEVFVAGVEGSLRAYDGWHRTGGVPELASFEQLEQERAAGRLRDVVQGRIAACF